MAQFTSAPEHYDPIRDSLADPIVTYEGLYHYDKSVQARLKLKTDETRTDGIETRVHNNETEVTRLDSVKAEKTALAKTDANVENLQRTKADQTELDKTNQSVKSNHTEIQNLSASLNTVNQTLHEDINSRINSLSSSFNALQGDFTQLSTSVNGLSALSGTVGDLQRDVSDLHASAGEGGGGGSSSGTVNAYTKSEADARFALKSELNSLKSTVSKLEKGEGGVSSEELQAVIERLEIVENALKPIGSIHVNITTNAALAKETIRVEHYDDTAGEKAQEKALVNGETTFSNLKQGDHERNRWITGYLKLWELNGGKRPDSGLYRAASFSATQDTVEYTDLPYGKFRITNNTSYEFDYYTYTVNNWTSRGLGKSDDDTGEWVNFTLSPGETKGLNISDSARYGKECRWIAHVAKGKGGKPMRYVGTPHKFEMGMEFEDTVTDRDLVEEGSGDSGAQGPEVFAAPDRDELLALKSRIESALSALEAQTEPGLEGPGL